MDAIDKADVVDMLKEVLEAPEAVEFSDATIEYGAGYTLTVTWPHDTYVVEVKDDENADRDEGQE